MGKKLYYYIVCITSEQKKNDTKVVQYHRIKDLGINKTISADRPYDPNRYTFFPDQKIKII